ncbi:hypothetical protein HYH03_000323 [Edaphochlamys debaryana]|uniref:Uncharacterized protein n=1 Tax=Edaphochlamys debaryana TaxID=47281 RepID=A0A835YHD4_9CHLO|nr:hypothetical protein HYH03_000323 [Edaphochlamys debaryana]|eukprot:KAG2501824.1 hypothetical protein HYH03_000323 [Edaphochlamys debaryana]
MLPQNFVLLPGWQKWILATMTNEQLAKYLAYDSHMLLEHMKVALAVLVKHGQPNGLSKREILTMALQNTKIYYPVPPGSGYSEEDIYQLMWSMDTLTDKCSKAPGAMRPASHMGAGTTPTLRAAGPAGSPGAVGRNPVLPSISAYLTKIGVKRKHDSVFQSGSGASGDGAAAPATPHPASPAAAQAVSPRTSGAATTSGGAMPISGAAAAANGGAGPSSGAAAAANGGAGPSSGATAPNGGGAGPSGSTPNARPSGAPALNANATSPNLVVAQALMHLAEHLRQAASRPE